MQFCVILPKVIPTVDQADFSHGQISVCKSAVNFINKYCWCQCDVLNYSHLEYMAFSFVTQTHSN